MKLLLLSLLVLSIGITGILNADAAGHHGKSCFFEKMKPLKWLCEPPPPPPPKTRDQLAQDWNNEHCSRVFNTMTYYDCDGDNPYEKP